MSNEIKVPYVERAAQATLQASAVSDRVLTEAHAEFEALAGKLEGNTVAAVNKAREIGLLLQARCGHNQMSLGFFDEYLKDKVPFDLSRVRMFMGIARRMTKPARTLTEARKLMQPMLLGADLMEIPQRTAPQMAIGLDPLMVFFAAIIRVRDPFVKLKERRPMEEWPAGDYTRFLSETQWIEDERNNARKLLATVEARATRKARA